MTNNETPRVRSLLRQAERNLEGGKYVAAEELYRQILDEAPDSAAAWLGLSKVAQAPAVRDDAYARAAALDPDFIAAAEATADEGDEPAAPDAAAVKSGAPTPDGANPALKVAAAGAVSGSGTNAGSEQRDQRYEVLEPDTQLVCYRHPGRNTSLRCYKCSKPICSECTVKTPVGYLCPDCYREAEDAFFNAKPTDYLLALIVALPISLLAGFLVTQFGRGFFFIIIMFFVGGFIGGVIGRVTKRVIGGRRGRYIPHLVAACVIIGVLVFALPALLAVFAGYPGALGALIGPGIYLATAVSSAYYWAR